LLDTPPGGAQQFPDVVGVVMHPERSPDDRRHPLGGPDLAPKAKVFGTLRQQGWEVLPLVCGQLWRGPGGGSPP
jgi:hypothetical protein